MSLARYTAKKKASFSRLLKEVGNNKICYIFLAPYAIVFALFFVTPLVISVFYSFTYFNILEPPKFIGLRNYINLLLGDDIFVTAMKNTFIMVAITGPID